MSKVSLSIKTKLWHILMKKCSSFFNSNFDFGRREISRSNLLFFHSPLLCCLKQHCLTFRVNIVSNLSRSENVLNNINPGLNSKNNVIAKEIVSRFRRLGWVEYLRFRYDVVPLYYHLCGKKATL